MVKRYRPLWLAIHKYVGLALGILITIIGFSGSILVYKHEIKGTLAPHLYYVEPSGNPAALEEVIESAVAAYPGSKPVYLRPNDGEPNGSHEVTLRRPSEVDLQVFVNPYTTQVLGARSGGTWLGIIGGLHADLLMGPVGGVILGIISIAMLITFVVGLILWWPSGATIKRALTISFKFGLERFLRDLHNVSGIYLLLIMFVLTFTGTVIVFPNATRMAVNLIVPRDPSVQQARPPSQPLPGGQSVSIAQAVNAARTIVPENEIKGVWAPFGPRGTYNIVTVPSGSSGNGPLQPVRVDQYSGEILVDPTAPNVDKLERYFFGWIDPLHSGAALGAPGRFLAFIGGLALPILFGSGTYMWYRRRQRS